MEANIEESDPNFMEYALKKSLISRNKLAIILKGSNNEVQYCCVECPARYEEKEKLELHLCMHNKEYRFLCGICGTGLKRKEHLERHTMEHQHVRPHVCPVCSKGFKRKEHLNIHQTIHYGDKSQVCSLCNRSFHRKDHLQKHLQTHNKLFLEQNIYTVSDDLIDIKNEVFDDDEKQEIESDMDYEAEGLESLDNSDCNGDSQGSSDTQDIRTPQVSDRPFICDICFKSYKRKDHLKIHSWTHMKKDKICKDCGKGFHKEDQLFAHKRVCIQVHLKQFKSDQPADDDQQFDSAEDFSGVILTDHSLLVERRKAASESRPHECVVCKRRFKRKQHLKVHANVHLKQTPTIWCSLCNEGFHSNDHFESHQCTPQSDPGEHIEDEHVPIIPLEAKKENSNPTQFLEQEMSEEEPITDSSSYQILQDEQNIPVPQRVFVCKFCSKPFKRKDHYKIHLHIHTGVKSFFCVDCGKGFYRKDHLQKHSQVHAKLKVKPTCKKQLPDLLPISLVAKKEIKPEITIHAPSNTKLRVPLQIKVPYQMVMSSDDGQQRTVTIDPQDERQHEVFA